MTGDMQPVAVAAATLALAGGDVVRQPEVVVVRHARLLEGIDRAADSALTLERDGFVHPHVLAIFEYLDMARYKAQACLLSLFVRPAFAWALDRTGLLALGRLVLFRGNRVH